MISSSRLLSHINRGMRWLLKYNCGMQAHPTAFVFDIDGTLVLNKKPITGASRTLNFLNTNKIPFVLLTNNIAQSQLSKAQQISTLLELEVPLDQRQVILNYTPIKGKLEQFTQGVVLMVGREVRLKEVLPLPKIHKYITVDEYCSLFPEAVPLAVQESKEKRAEVQIRVKQRLGVAELDKYQLKIAAVMILTTPNIWQQCYQVIIDCLSTQDGFLSQDHQYRTPEKHIPVITCYNDLFHLSQQHNLPRLLMKPFNEGLKSVYKLVYGKELQIQIYGKPHPNAFAFAQQQLEQLYGSSQKIVMVGDNIEADIVCPVALGWDTILVKSGVSKQDYYHATVNCGNVEQGMRIYLKGKHQMGQ